MEKVNNCWECGYCTVIGDGGYVGWHKCALMGGNVEYYANKIDPLCPVLIKRNRECGDSVDQNKWNG